MRHCGGIVSPEGRIGIDIEFDHDAIGIVAIQGLTDVMVSLSGQGHAMTREMIATGTQFVQRNRPP